MTFQRVLISTFGVAAAAMISGSAVGGERTVVGEYFTATW